MDRTWGRSDFVESVRGTLPSTSTEVLVAQLGSSVPTGLGQPGVTVGPLTVVPTAVPTVLVVARAAPPSTPVLGPVAGLRSPSILAGQAPVTHRRWVVGQTAQAPAVLEVDEVVPEIPSVLQRHASRGRPPTVLRWAMETAFPARRVQVKEPQGLRVPQVVPRAPLGRLVDGGPAVPGKKCQVQAEAPPRHAEDVAVVRLPPVQDGPHGPEEDARRRVRGGPPAAEGSGGRRARVGPETPGVHRARTVLLPREDGLAGLDVDDGNVQGPRVLSIVALSPPPVPALPPFTTPGRTGRSGEERVGWGGLK